MSFFFSNSLAPQRSWYVPWPIVHCLEGLRQHALKPGAICVIAPLWAHMLGIGALSCLQEKYPQVLLAPDLRGAPGFALAWIAQGGKALFFEGTSEKMQIVKDRALFSGVTLASSLLFPCPCCDIFVDFSRE